MKWGLRRLSPLLDTSLTAPQEVGCASVKPTTPFPTAPQPHLVHCPEEFGCVGEAQVLESVEENEHGKLDVHLAEPENCHSILLVTRSKWSECVRACALLLL